MLCNNPQVVVVYKNTHFFPLTRKFVLAGMALLQMVGELGEAAGWVQGCPSSPTRKEQQLLRARFPRGVTQEGKIKTKSAGIMPTSIPSA